MTDAGERPQDASSLVQVVVFVADHSVAHPVVEEHPVEPQRVLRVRLRKNERGVIWVVAFDPAKLLAVDVVGAPEGNVEQPRGLQLRAESLQPRREGLRRQRPVLDAGGVDPTLRDRGVVPPVVEL